MSKLLDLDDRTALLKHYQINVAEGHVREGTPMVIVGTSSDLLCSIKATVGADSVERLCPVTEFLAEGLIAEIGNPHLAEHPQLRRALAHLVMKLSDMFLDSSLAGFSLTATIEGDHYEVMPKTASIDATHETTIPHRLSPHAHDRGTSQSLRTSDR